MNSQSCMVLQKETEALLAVQGATGLQSSRVRPHRALHRLDAACCHVARYVPDHGVMVVAGPCAGAHGLTAGPLHPALRAMLHGLAHTWRHGNTLHQACEATANLCMGADFSHHQSGMKGKSRP